MIELFVVACVAANVCRDFVLQTIPKEEMTPYKCSREVVELYVKQKHPAYPNYVVRKYGCRKRVKREI